MYYIPVLLLEKGTGIWDSKFDLLAKEVHQTLVTNLQGMPSTRSHRRWMTNGNTTVLSANL